MLLILFELVTQRKPSLQWNMGLSNTGSEKERGALMLTGLARVLHENKYIWGKKGEVHPPPSCRLPSKSANVYYMTYLPLWSKKDDIFQVKTKQMDLRHLNPLDAMCS